MKDSLHLKLGLALGFSLSFVLSSLALRVKPEEPQYDALNRMGSGAILSLSFSPDGKWVAAAGYNEGDGMGLRLWDIQTKRARLLHSGSINAAAFSPDGRWIAYARDQRLERLDLSNGFGFEVGKQNSDIYSLSWSPDGNTIATAGGDGRVRTWDVKERTSKIIGRSANGDVDSVAFSPSGRWVAAGGDDGPATLWEAATGSSIRTQGPAGDEVFGLAFSADERYLVWAASNSKAAPCLWDLKASVGRCLQSNISNASPYAAAFAPDGRSFVVGWSNGRVLRYSTEGRPTETLAEGQRPIYSIAISPDGKTLVTGDLSGQVQFWGLK